MNRSTAMLLLACVMSLCAVVVAMLGLTGHEFDAAAWFGRSDDAATALAEAQITAAPPQEADVQPSASASAQPGETGDVTMQAQSTAQPAMPAEGNVSLEASPDAQASVAPSEQPASSELRAISSLNKLSAPESFGTPEKMDEQTPRYSYGALSLETGLDVEVLEKMYSPFYVLDIDMSEVYYPLTSPGGRAGSNKIYGGQVGVEVVSIEGDYAYINAYRYPGGRAIDGYVPVSMLKEVTPDDQYSIIIDKRQQRLFLFEYGELKADMYCSTGKTTTETPAGEFLKYGTKRTIYSDADPDIAYYGIKLNGRVYIHSVSHIDGDYSVSIDMLGRKASHGCIRVPLDWAEWFYDNIPDNTKILITEYRGETPPLGEGGREGD